MADDTRAWTDFQAASGIKAVPPGRYKVNGEVLRFDQGCLGNGVFDDETIAWEEMAGDRYGVRYDELAAFILCAILPDTP